MPGIFCVCSIRSAMPGSRRTHRTRVVIAIAMAFGVAACATTTPAPDSGPAPVVSAPAIAAESAANAADSAAPVIIAPASTLLKPFAEPIAAELEPLPPPADDLWERIRKGFTIADLDDPYVGKWEQWYSERPDYVERMIDRSRRYLYHIVAEVEARGLPLEIALLPMIESAYNPVALSTSRASGIWQFVPSTGRRFGLKQTFWFDSRRDVIAATDGALDYLQKLYAQFGDWRLALAAYNWGEGNVARAIERNQRQGKPTDYASLAMPSETRNYLPKLQAEEHRSRSRQVRAGLGGRSRCAVLRGGQDVAADGRQACCRARRIVGRGIPVPESATQPAGDRRRRPVHDPAADRQGGAFRGKARAHQSAARLVAGVPPSRRRDAAAGRREVLDVGRDAARGERNRLQGARSERTRAARAHAAADRRDGRLAVAHGVHHGAAGTHVLL